MTNALMAAHHHHHHHHPDNNTDTTARRRVKFGQLLYSSEPNIFSPINDTSIPDENDTNSSRQSSASEFTSSSSPRSSFYHDDNNNNNINNSPYLLSSPWSQTTSPYLKSPWLKLSPLPYPDTTPNNNTNNNIYYSRGRSYLIGSLVREEGHVYSLAVNSNVLYTGSESKNIRVWRNFHDAGGFKTGSGLVKAIVVSSDPHRRKVFTGHQDGKIRVWSESGKRVGTLPKLSDFLKASLNPNSYVEVRRHHKVPRIKHYDAVSCLALNDKSGLLYSGSWDKTVKVWRVSDGRWLESIAAHDDAINSVVVGLGGLVFSGSADGTVKVWRRELQGRGTRHFCVRVLMREENAVTSLAVAEHGGVAAVYGGSSEGLVSFWEKEKEELVYGGVLRGHKMAVLCLATAGCLVFSGSADKTICVWRREGGGIHSCLAVLSGHNGPVKCLAVTPDHDHHERDRGQDDEEEQEKEKEWIVYSGSLDKSVRIWRVSEHAHDELST